MIAELSASLPRRAIAHTVDRITHIGRSGAGRPVEAILAVAPDASRDHAVRRIA